MESDVNAPHAGDFDAVVVGGGFYGCSLAVFLAESSRRVAVIEKQPDLLTRASFVNQARVHGGYHYPRSFMTAARSALHYPRFIKEFQDCIEDRFEAVYAVARQQSHVTAYQFLQFCRHIGAPVRQAPPAIRQLFRQEMIEDVFCVREHAFNAVKLRERMRGRLEEAGVHTFLGIEADRIARDTAGTLRLRLSGGVEISCRSVYNCAYSQINQLLANSGVPALPLKHEITELALIEPPEPIRHMAITVMDGPFFSTMPFPALGLHTLSHVRYTPHESWREPEIVRDSHRYLEERHPEPKYPFMVKDAQRYLPCLAGARYVRSLFEVKTVLVQNEVDDGRPILFRRHPELGNAVTIMGGKIDNIYEVLAMLNQLHGLAAQKTMAAYGANS
jgi:glycine/D-amino acid oxidase-like deaminating enzyme